MEPVRDAAGVAMSERTELETAYWESVADGVVQVTMNRPDQANAVVPALARDLLECLTRLEKDRSVRVLVLTGAGRHFSGGADLHQMQRYLNERLEKEHEPYNARVLFPVTEKLVSCRMPIIAAVNGSATAGGFDLTLACDIRIASSKAKFGETYIKIGMMPGNGGTYFLPRLVGSGVAAELALTGDLVDAERALAIGLVNHVVEHEELLDRSVALAAGIAEKPWRALEATKQALRASWQMDLQSVLAMSFWSVAALTYTHDLHEGVDAFIEKRKPEFGANEPENMHWDV
jgi:enoyl-CoA hydratase